MMDTPIQSFRTGKERRCTCSLYMTEQCNLKCIYCYEHIKRDRLMPLDVAIKGIESTFERAVRDKIDYVEILFHGGEPFIAFDRIKEICNWLWSREWPTKYICYATTNGTLVHGEIKQWLADNKHRFVVGLSLDGTREMHNHNRSDSYDRIDIDFFRDTWPDQGVKMTPSPDTIQTLARGVIHIHESGFRRNNCTFASGVDWAHTSDGTAIDYEKILQEQFHILARYYLDHPETMPVDMLNMRLIAVAAGMKSMRSKLCGAGTIMRCYTPDGQCLPCHLFYEVYKKTGVAETFDLSDHTSLSDPHCRDCCLEPVCPTCYGGNYITYGDICHRDPYTCNITKLRALAASWMLGHMLESPDKYVATRNLTTAERAMTVKGILQIQQYLLSDEIISRITG